MSESVQAGTLYLVPTPLGNLSDITLRAIETLKNVDVIACEDTRHSLRLLNHLGISKPLVSYHAHSSRHKERQVLDRLSNGQSVALITDAGTPALSDPGEALVRQALQEGRPVISLPGPCAAVTALVASGFPTDHFFFIGFLPRRSIRAQRVLSRALETGATVVVYESPYRVKETLEHLEKVGGSDLPVVLARELTKIYEEFRRGTALSLRQSLDTQPVKGEVVILARKQTEETES